MRINKLLYIGRLELYIGRRTHWTPQWRASRVPHGWGLWAGHWHMLAAWCPPRRPHAEVMAELLAEAKEGAAARRKAKAEARERLRLAKERVLAKGRLYRVRPCRAAA